MAEKETLDSVEEGKVLGDKTPGSSGNKRPRFETSPVENALALSDAERVQELEKQVHQLNEKIAELKEKLNKQNQLSPANAVNPDGKPTTLVVVALFILLRMANRC